MYAIRSYYEGIKTLVVDNHKTNLLLLKKTLNNWGIVSQSSFDEKSALEIIKEKQDLDLVIIDAHVFSKAEEGFLQELKKENPRLKTILFTSEHKWESKYDEEEVDKIIHKPIKHNDLFV